jgi:hypothetical protein
LRGALATKQSILSLRCPWIASLALAMTLKHHAQSTGAMTRCFI